MRCPKCNAPNLITHLACKQCGFRGASTDLETLAHLNWILDEFTKWQGAGVNNLVEIRRTYETQRRALMKALGLHPPPFTGEVAREAWIKLYRQARFHDCLQEWRHAELLRPEAVERLTQRIEDFITMAQAGLEQAPGFDFLLTPERDLTVVDFLLDNARQLEDVEAFVSPEARGRAVAPLLAERDRLIHRAPPAQAEEAMATDVARPETGVTRAASLTPPAPAPVSAESSAALPPAVPRPPTLPFRERLVRTLLSERTLHAILFLGIFLLFSAAVTFVIWGWKDFSPPLRVAIPAAFTLTFFALSWYMRTRTALSRSGVALQAIGALLIPIDFYTAYINLDPMPGRWAEFWLLTSILCLVIYIIVALRLQSPFFGYLIATATGSATLAVVEVAQQHDHLSRDWYAAALAVLALGLMGSGAVLHRHRHRTSRWQVYVDPFRTFALLLIGVLMPLALGWRAIDRPTYDALHASATVVWWVGSLMFGWGAILYGSRTLGLLAVLALPAAVTLTQAALFDAAGTNAAWHAFGWACLTPVYILAGRWLSHHSKEPLQAQGRLVNVAAIILILLSAFWSLTDLSGGAAAAGSHTILVIAVALAAALEHRPGYLYPASLLALTAATFAMTELALTLTQLSVGWASLALVMVLLALRLRGDFAAPVVRAAYVIAGLATLLPLRPYDRDLAIYALGNWIALAGWGATLAHARRNGFVSPRTRVPALFHWGAALPLPVWLWMAMTRGRDADVSTVLALAALSWGMVALSHRLGRIELCYRRAWRGVGLAAAASAIIAAFVVDSNGFGPALTLLSAGMLVFADAVAGQQGMELAPAGLATAVGLFLLLDRLHVNSDAAALGLSLLTAVYILVGLDVERRRDPTWSYPFLHPLYVTAHLLTLVILGLVYRAPLTTYSSENWTDAMKLWGAGSQLVLGIAYGLFAWGRYQKAWSHAAAWLGTAAGGLVFVVYSQGRGSSAAKVAILASAYILAERVLNRIQQEPRLSRRVRARCRLAWDLYRHALLVAGWALSGATVALALARNLWLLGGGRTRELWAVAGLLMITGLYALSARLFRRPCFAWLSAALVFAPWTLLTHLGWFTPYRLTLPGYAASWAILAWVLYGVGRALKRRAPAYALPFRAVAHLALPVALTWGIADAETSRVSFALAIGLYGWGAWLEHRELRAGRGPQHGANLQLFPALGLIPVWSLTLLAWHVPTAPHEAYGLLLLAFGPLGLAGGQLLRRIAPTTPDRARQYARPAYLTAYGAMIVGTLLTAHLPGLLALVLLFDALMMLISARLWSEPLWIFLAGILTPMSLLLALTTVNVALNRRGWWLLGLAAVYLALAGLLRRTRHPITARIPLVLGFALIALALPPSSQDRIGALWGYAGAAGLYAVSAFWLRQPLLLAAAAALIPVSYALGLREIGLPEALRGLALLPGALVALAAALLLDRRYGGWHDFPWSQPGAWLRALTQRVLAWWALPLYTLGFGLATAAPLFSAGRADLAALGWVFLMPIYGGALSRFRRRGWLLALGLAGHFALAAYLDHLGWWEYPTYAWLRFLPLTVVTTFAALGVQRQRQEAAPTTVARAWAGWSRPLYALALIDIVLGQIVGGFGTDAGAQIALVHALLLGITASIWQTPTIVYTTGILGVVALLNQLAFARLPLQRITPALAQLALGYGLLGFGLDLVRQRRPAGGRGPKGIWVWERPMQRTGLALSGITLLITLIAGGRLAAWTVRAVFGIPFRHLVDLPTARMVVGVLSLLGLLYIAASAVTRRVRVGYFAVAMLLLSWLLYAFYIQVWDSTARIQWYAVPAGLYLLGVSALECARGHKSLARRLDYAGLLLLFGSLFWQTLLYGWNYAVMLAAEGLLALWWGSGRRLRRFLYGGMVAVMLATLGQLIHSLQSVLQWIIVSVIVGLSLFLLGAFVERNLGKLKVSLQEALETWE